MSAPSNTVTWAQARHLLAAPWRWRANEKSLWALRVYGGLVLLLFLVPTAGVLAWLPLPVAATVVGVLAFLAVMACWGLHVGCMLRLDHPHAAHTVPGHGRALRVVTVGLWLALVALSGGVATLGAWLLAGSGFWAGLHVGLAVVAGASAVLFLQAMAVRWWWLWLPLSLGPAFMGVPVWGRTVMAASAWVKQQWLAQPLLLALGLVLLQALLLPVVFGRGDVAHAQAYARRERLRKITADGAGGSKPTLAAYGRWGERLGLPWQRLADAWLAHVCHAAQPTPRSVLARAEVVLHGSQHWVRFIASGLLVQVLVALCLAVTLWLTGVNLQVLLDGGHVGISIGLTSMALSAVMSLPAALWHSRREQALLLLLPGMPRGAALNRAVAWRQFRQCLGSWAVMLPALVTMLWAGHAMSLLTYVMLALPVSAWLWRDPSRLREARASGAVVPMLLCLLGGVLAAFVMSRFPDLWLPWLLGLLALTAGLLAWRWRRMADLPQALPAGRLG